MPITPITPIALVRVFFGLFLLCTIYQLLLYS